MKETIEAEIIKVLTDIRNGSPDGSRPLCMVFVVQGDLFMTNSCGKRVAKF